MGVIKDISDQVIINNESELITPAIVRQVNDVIDAQVEAAKTSISTLEQNLTTLNSGTIPNGGITGQVLSKKTNTDKDVHWIDSAGGGNASGDYLPLAGGNMTGDINLGYQHNIIGVNNIDGVEGFFQSFAANQLKTFDLRNGRDTQIMYFGDDKAVINAAMEYQNANGSMYDIPPFNDFSLVHKKYVDDALQNNSSSEDYLPLSGGNMQGTLSMGFENIENLEQLYVNLISSCNTINPVFLETCENIHLVPTSTLQEIA